MSTLHPTPTRLALLADVDAGEVWQWHDGSSVATTGDPWRPTRTVNAAIAALADAGWVTLVAQRYGSRQWQLTDAGRTILDQHRRAES